MIHYLLSLRSLGHLVGDVIAHADNESCQHPLHPLNKRSTLKGAEGEKGLVLLSLWFVLMNGVTLFLPQNSTAQHSTPPLPPAAGMSPCRRTQLLNTNQIWTWFSLSCFNPPSPSLLIKFSHSCSLSVCVLMFQSADRYACVRLCFTTTTIV